MWIRILLALASFFVYAAGVLHLDPGNTSEWGPESTDSIPAAISFAVHGYRLGTIDRDVWGVMHPPRDVNSVKLKRIMEQVIEGPAGQHGALQTTTDGNGIGYFIFGGVAFKLLGPHLSSLTDLFLLLLGLSALAFVTRFQDNRSFVVPLFFLSLTVMLLTPLTNPSAWNETPIGGIRYFILAGILPAFHLCFEFRERSSIRQTRANGLPVLLAVQVLLLTLVVFIRGNAAYLAAPIAIQALFGLRDRWPDRAQLARAIDKITAAGVLALAGATFLIIAVVSDYAKTGLINPGVGLWHRAFIGLGAHPAWPSPGLREVFDCTNSQQHPEGLKRGILDANARCAAIHYGGEISPYDLFNSEYQLRVRSAFFYVVRNYPRETIETFLYYKPLMMWDTIITSLRLDFSGPRAAILPMALVQLLIFLAFICFGMTPGYPGDVILTTKIIVLFALFSIPSYLLAWSNLHTSTDLIFYTYSALALVLAFIVGWNRGMLQRNSGSQLSTGSQSTTTESSPPIEQVRSGSLVFPGPGQISVLVKSQNHNTN
jgi:hypothetical protein